MERGTAHIDTARRRAAKLALALLFSAAGLVWAATSALAVEGSRYRPPVESPGGIVATESPAASRVGRAVLLRGGNAVDAAVSTVFAMSVARPQSCGIGGGGFMVVRTAGGRVATLDFRETAGAATTATTFAGPGPHRQFTGRRTVGVPGTVAGMQEALDAFGTIPLAEAIRPAVGLARGGFRVPVSLSGAMAQNAERLRLFPASAAQYLKGGTTPYAAGERLVQEDQAETLELIAEGGPDAFYRGPIARRIVADMANADAKLAGDLGLLTLQDFANYRARFRPALVGTYRGRTLVTMPPPTSGGIATLQMLNLLEGYDLGAFGAGSANALHVIAESQKIAFADRAAYVADPGFVRVPEALTTKAYATTRRAEIDLARAKTYRAGQVGAARARAGWEVDGQGTTTHLSVVDAQGNAVALTCTIEQEFGSAVVVPGLGFLLNNELTDFGDPGTANQPAPGKRPRSSMSPTIVVRDDRPEVVIGGSGGVRIIMGALLGVVGGVDFGRNVGQAIDAERIDANGPGGTLVAEGARIAPSVVADLTARGHRITNVGEYDIRPRVQIAGIDLATGRRVGQSDPRSDFATLAARRPAAATGRPRDDVRAPTVGLERAVRGRAVALSWRGRDRGGAGIASFAVQVREPGEAGYRTLLGRTGRTSLTVPARRAGTYAFRVRATDAGGNVSRYDAARVRVPRG